LKLAVVSIAVAEVTVDVISVNKLPPAEQPPEIAPSLLQSTFPAQSIGGSVSLPVDGSTVKE
jgi:hypothetical protein